MIENIKEAGWQVVGAIVIAALFAASYVLEFSWYAILDWFWALVG